MLLLDLFRSEVVRLDESLSSSRRTVELFLTDLKSHPEHLAGDWTVTEMATCCGLGVTQFIHYVRSLTNLTPAQYVSQCRIETAAGLLHDQPTATITDVALAVGFSSSQYFATVFNQHYGCSPREYRIRSCS